VDNAIRLSSHERPPFGPLPLGESIEHRIGDFAHPLTQAGPQPGSSALPCSVAARWTISAASVPSGPADEFHGSAVTEHRRVEQIWMCSQRGPRPPKPLPRVFICARESFSGRETAARNGTKCPFGRRYALLGSKELISPELETHAHDDNDSDPPCDGSWLLVDGLRW
jgi:hypothetical protein